MTQPEIAHTYMTDFVIDNHGHFWWSERSNPTEWHGPFETEEEAERDSDIVLLGPNVKVVDGGKFGTA
jgi:hypothetical protein